jgi:hypothetical protein
MSVTKRIRRRDLLGGAAAAPLAAEMRPDPISHFLARRREDSHAD